MSLTTAIGQVGFGAVGTVAAYSSFGFLANAVLAAAAALATAGLVWRYLPEPRREWTLQDACARKGAARVASAYDGIDRPRSERLGDAGPPQAV